MAIPEPRLVTMRIRPQERHAIAPKGFTRPQKTCIETEVDSIPTSLLHTCVESRQVALRHYEEAFGGIEGVKKIFFDFQRDVLCLDGDRVLARFCDGEPDPYAYGYHQVRFVPPGVEAWQKKVQKLALTGDVSLRFNVPRLLDLVRGKLKVLYLAICIVEVKDQDAEEDWARRALIEGWLKTLGIDGCDGLPEIKFVSPQQLRGIAGRQ